MSGMSAIRGLFSRIVANFEREIPSSEKEEETRLDIVGLLENETALNVLSFLEPQDLATCSKVCRRWKILADEDVLWKGFIEDKEIEISGKSVKEYIKAQSPVPGAIFCRSLDEAILGIEDFFRDLPVGQKGRFRVILSQSNEEITFEHGMVDPKVDERLLRDRVPDFIKTWFLIYSKIDPGITFSSSGVEDYTRDFSGNKLLLAVYTRINNTFYRADLEAKIEKATEKVKEIIAEKAKKFANEPKKSLFKREINYYNEHRVTTVVGVCLCVLGSYFINNNL